MKDTIQNMKRFEYYIGLKKDSTSGEWKWLSDNSKVNATRGKFPWAEDEPSGDGSCAVMFGHFKQNNGLFNDLRCDIYRGYICESLTKSTDQEGMSYKLSRYLLRQTISKSKTVYDSLKWLLDRESTEITKIEFNKDKSLLVMSCTLLLDYGTISC